VAGAGAGPGPLSEYFELARTVIGRSTPYHLAHGLLDHAEYLTGLGDTAAALAIAEARSIGDRLRCRPLLDRANALDPLTPGVKVYSPR
jgi:hypothetical protein